MDNNISHNFLDSRIQNFIHKNLSPGSYLIKSMKSDAGLRSYTRLKLLNQNQSPDRLPDSDSLPDSLHDTLVLMNCPPDYASLLPFINIAKQLSDNGFSAPKIMDYDLDQGFMLIEDLGVVSIKDYIKNNSNTAQLHNPSKSNDADKTHTEIYHLMIDCLIEMQNQKISSDNLKHYTNNRMLDELKLFLEYYIPYRFNTKVTEKQSQEFFEIWAEILQAQIPMKSKFVHMDYHVENIMYLSERESIQKLGIIDFQDATIGSPIYDLVSLLEDARITVPRETALRYIDYFVEQSGLSYQSVLLNYHILGAQRNLRILGVFARKNILNCDHSYLQYLPRVLEYLSYDFANPIFQPFQQWMMRNNFII